MNEIQEHPENFEGFHEEPLLEQIDEEEKGNADVYLAKHQFENDSNSTSKLFDEANEKPEKYSKKQLKSNSFDSISGQNVRPSKLIPVSVKAEDSLADSGFEDNKTIEMFGNLPNNVFKSQSFAKNIKSDISVRMSNNSISKVN